MNRRRNEGITIVSLVITIIVLLIVTGISVTGAIKGHKETKEASIIAELNMIQHTILERYTKSKLTKEQLPGDEIEDILEVQSIIEDINSKAGSQITLKGTEYKRLQKEHLENLGILEEEDTYIVNYKTGEVINETVRVTDSGKALYIYSRNEK